MKAAIIALFCAAGILAVAESADLYSPYTFTAGARPFADKQFLREDIKRNAVGPYRKFSEVKTFTTDGKARITMIEAINLKKNGSTVKILEGGPGQTYVRVLFESAPGHGLHYDFKLYARY